MNESLNLLICGDFYPGNRWEEFAMNQPKKLWSEEVVDIFNKSDFRIVNLETPLTEFDTPIVKSGPNLKCNPKTINALNYLDVDLVTLANNHVFDQGAEGLISTLEICKDNNINTVGAGVNKDEAKKSCLVKNSNVRILNYTLNEFGIAEENIPGSNSYDIIGILNDIKEAKENFNFIILIIHYGHEFYNLPSPKIKEDFRFFIDFGADLIVSHHSHCASGYEIYKNKHIFYGIGNFLLDWPTKFAGFFEGMFLEVKIKDSKLEHFELIPYSQTKNNQGVELLKGEEKNDFLKNIANLSEIIISHDSLKQKWNNHISKMAMGYYTTLMGMNPYIPHIVKKIPFLKPFFFKEKRFAVTLNLLRAETHQEVLIDVLTKMYNKEI